MIGGKYAGDRMISTLHNSSLQLKARQIPKVTDKGGGGVSQSELTFVNGRKEGRTSH